uniref:15-hydroxyprostaglandin dehydrogenase [NAD(+)] n=1 Tax=Neolamprologus brichardi TaxID=32507 RepID=A0A3Q4H6D9_NEOBR
MALSGKTAVVTGAAMGIGKAITEILLKNGAKVALLDKNKAAGESVVEALSKEYEPDRMLFRECNIKSDEEFKAAFQKAVETFGGIDILCNNAGMFDESEWENMVSTNLVGSIRGTYLALEHMNKSKGGQGGVIINVSSLAGLGPLLTGPVYSATKHGLVGFTRSISHRLAAIISTSDYGIRANAICPGFVQTNLISEIKSQTGQFAHLVDVAECILELVTDETKNGEALVVVKDSKFYVTFPTLDKSSDKP